MQAAVDLARIVREAVHQLDDRLAILPTQQ
jgi:hypothetical protein